MAFQFRFYFGFFSLLFSVSTVAVAQEFPAVEKPVLPDTLAAPTQKGRSFNLIPLPMYSTTPNEGATYGFMPVFLVSEPGSEQIDHIFAPSLSWNEIIHITTTGRYYYFPDDFTDLNIFVTYATRLYREAVLEYTDQNRTPNAWTYGFSSQYRVDPFRRFFGIGKNTARSDETSYTLQYSKTYGRMGYNLTDRINVNGTASFWYHKPLDYNFPNVVSTFKVHPTVHGINDSTTGLLSVGCRYDTRKNREYSSKGTYGELQVSGALNRNNDQLHPYASVKMEGKKIWEETSWATGAARVYWMGILGGNISFYEKPSLGGSFLMRGFMMDRFIDDNAWSLELEQRLVPYKMKIMGTEVHFHTDPFVTLGQVYNDTTEMFDRVQATYGIGIRFFAPPNVIGRIDMARGGPDWNVYVEMGYPF